MPESLIAGCRRFGGDLSLANLKTPPRIAERLAIGTITLHGRYYDLTASKVERLKTIGAAAEDDQPRQQSAEARI